MMTTKKKIIIALSIFIIIGGLSTFIAFITFQDGTKKEESQPTVLKYFSDIENPFMIEKMILNDKKQWTQSNSTGKKTYEFEIKNLDVKPNTSLVKGNRIMINGMIYEIKDIADSEMTIEKIQPMMN